ncbi:3-dehydroquinate synthase [Candidatus Peregrinibacteria bacterium]|nr:3-dehydroquinate synthase [Candidatus Peregrinibacteria bacterium]
MIKHIISLQKKIDHSYSIVIGTNMMNSIADELKKHFPASKYIIITDHTVKKLHGKKILKKCKKHGLKTSIIALKSGETSKNLQSIEKIINKMTKKSCDRSSMIVALGGGVIGDIAGFVASIFMRGIPYIQIPTTLLAMVDSSIGGKTGVNNSLAKNMIGTFHQPKKVYIDTFFLQTLPRKHIQNGVVEVIKHAIIRDAELFDYLEKNAHAIFNAKNAKNNNHLMANTKNHEKNINTILRSKNSEKNDENKIKNEIMNKIIIQSCKIKARVIEKDEKENNIRMLLNYGHTLGHAIEQVTNYRLLHGICVAKGIILINKIAVKKKWMEKIDSEKIQRLLETFEIDTSLPKKIDKNALMKTLHHDKKFHNGKKNWIIVKKIGHAEIVTDIKNEDIKSVLKNEHETKTRLRKS